MKVLVTGGAGFIGSHLVDRLSGEGFETIVYDNFSTGLIGNINSSKLPPPAKIIRGDILDSKKLARSLVNVDAVVHLAAIASVNLSVENPLIVHRANATGTLQLLNSCIERKVRRFLFASSAAVYSETQHKSKESDLPGPLSPYGASKVAGEAYCSAFHRTKDLETTVLRFMNVYGPRSVSGPYSGVMSKFAEAVSKTRSLIVFGEGKQSRDFIHVSDVVEALIRALKSPRAIGEILNVGTGSSTTIERLAHIFGEYNPSSKIIHRDRKSGDIMQSCADVTKARRLIGFSSKIQIQQGVENFFSWYQESCASEKGVAQKLISSSSSQF